MTSHNNTRTVTTHILRIIDDKRQYANDWFLNNIKYIIKILQHAAQTWEDALNITGDELERTKCTVYIIE